MKTLNALRHTNFLHSINVMGTKSGLTYNATIQSIVSANNSCIIAFTRNKRFLFIFIACKKVLFANVSA